MLTAQELQAKRREQHMTQAQLAQAIGIEANLITRYEQGKLPISVEDEEKLQALWNHSVTAAKPGKSRSAKPEVKKVASTREPSLSKWLQNLADNGPDRPSTHSAPNEPAREETSSRVVQAAAQITSDKQRRVALNNLLTAALSQVDKLFVEDKQLRTMAETIEQLEPAYQQVVLGLINQFEHLDPTPPSKRRPGPEQIVETLKDASAYGTVLNYLEAALQLLRQAELADRPALMTRLQNLSEFDQNTVQLITKRYQTSPRGQPPESTTDEASIHRKANS